MVASGIISRQIGDWLKLAKLTPSSHASLPKTHLAFKWIRIAFRCWKDHKPYDKTLHNAVLRERQCRKAENPSNQLIITWKNCGGFSKPDAIIS
jgi:hypothetical protein